ncbi:MAG: branched-chain amino acid ABC transporter permease [Intrasporangium sp.]|uniref:branched-chain amino acid ABC transporter permease n=1 Tax=Intrasporangium sp. TaxID=1925024 RepID=UPI0026477FC7|nr:branched-chain amino acid ABC transporter permease [Intrasporangium sp.]MDN5795673.1 branched-chain amino acid ABC transporter permease [Intrasporangium sp.]
MRPRLMAIVAAFFLLCLTGVGAASAALVGTPTTANRPAVLTAEGDQSLKGTLRGPDGKPLSGVTVTAEQNGTSVGSATSNAEGQWEVPLPSPGEYTLKLDLSTLPDGVQPRDKGGEVLEAVVVRPQQQRTVIFPLVSTSQQQQEKAGSVPQSTSGPTQAGDQNEPGATGESGEGTTPNRVLQLVVEGIKLGAIIAITAVGLSLIFGTTRLINFAHGEIVTIGAVVAFWVSTSPGSLPLVIGGLAAVVAGGLLGGGLEGGLWRPMRRRSTGLIQMFIISIGLSLFLRYLILVLFSGRREKYSQYALQPAMHLGPISITPRDLIVTLASFAILILVAVLLQRTRMGKAARAVADNKDLAEASGIDVDRVILSIWVIGGALAALGGVFYGLTQGAVYWDMGFNLLLLMFAGVILGGLGSAYGAMIGSIIVGLVSQLSNLWFPPSLQNAWALLVLIIVLLVRPQGILGRAERAG